MKKEFDFNKLFTKPKNHFHFLPILIIIIISFVISFFAFKFCWYNDFKKIQFNIPTYLEVNLDDVLTFNIQVYNIRNELLQFNYKVNISGDQIIQIKKTNQFQIKDNKNHSRGYCKIDFELFGYHHISYLFIAPISSKFSFNKYDIDYYRTQFDTGLNGNCGPSVLSMSILWSINKDVPVQNIRNFIGYPRSDGAIGFYSINRTLNYYNVPYKFHYYIDEQDIFRIIDRGHIVIILFDTSTISINKHYEKNLFGRYYDDNSGHYIIVKGYSLDRRFFIVYDSIPIDWYLNKFRYADGISMAGKNRYYLIKEIFKSINRTIIEIF